MGIIFLFLMLVIQLYGVTWLRGFISGARVTFLELISLSLRKVPVSKIVDVRITLIKTGFNVS
ncbi:MAG: flotillin-like FloA family protein, partial [Verrucomicrobiota bacterium]|nr:flotillin-like FloA family protein [Verrucomicrobiota bacterium]